jgi:hypothetical protein
VLFKEGGERFIPRAPGRFHLSLGQASKALAIASSNSMILPGITALREWQE